jgi:hypothetical protein
MCQFPTDTLKVLLRLKEIERLSSVCLCLCLFDSGTLRAAFLMSIGWLFSRGQIAKLITHSHLVASFGMHVTPNSCTLCDVVVRNVDRNYFCGFVYSNMPPIRRQV